MFETIFYFKLSKHKKDKTKGETKKTKVGLEKYSFIMIQNILNCQCIYLPSVHRTQTTSAGSVASVCTSSASCSSPTFSVT